MINSRVPDQRERSAQHGDVRDVLTASESCELELVDVDLMVFSIALDTDKALRSSP